MNVVYLYWAHNSKNVIRHFMSEKHYHIGQEIRYNGEYIIIDDMAEEYKYNI